MLHIQVISWSSKLVENQISGKGNARKVKAETQCHVQTQNDSQGAFHHTSQQSMISFVVVFSTCSCEHLRDWILKASGAANNSYQESESCPGDSLWGQLWNWCTNRPKICVLIQTYVWPLIKSLNFSVSCFPHLQCPVSRFGRVCKSSWKPKKCYSYVCL